MIEFQITINSNCTTRIAFQELIPLQVSVPEFVSQLYKNLIQTFGIANLGMRLSSATLVAYDHSVIVVGAESI